MGSCSQLSQIHTELRRWVFTLCVQLFEKLPRGGLLSSLLYLNPGAYVLLAATLFLKGECLERNGEREKLRPEDGGSASPWTFQGRKSWHALLMYFFCAHSLYLNQFELRFSVLAMKILNSQPHSWGRFPGLDSFSHWFESETKPTAGGQSLQAARAPMTWGDRGVTVLAWGGRQPGQALPFSALTAGLTSQACSPPHHTPFHHRPLLCPCGAPSRSRTRPVTCLPSTPDAGGPGLPAKPSL